MEFFILFILALVVLGPYGAGIMISVMFFFALVAMLMGRK